MCVYVCPYSNPSIKRSTKLNFTKVKINDYDLGDLSEILKTKDYIFTCTILQEWR